MAFVTWPGVAAAVAAAGGVIAVFTAPSTFVASTTTVQSPSNYDKLEPD